MTEFENKNNQNKILEISNPSSPKVDNIFDSNNEKELEKNDLKENIIQEDTIKSITEEKDVNKSQKEQILTQNEATQRSDDLLNNSLEKEEKEEKEENKSKEMDINGMKEEHNLHQNEINNNNITKMLNLTNNDIMNLVKSQSYLTNLPISKNKTSKNQDNSINNLKIKKENKKTYNNLKEKENSICIGINAIKQKRESLQNYSYELIGTKNIVENNIINNELKKLKTNENNLLEKLQSVKQQIVTLINDEKKINRKNNIKEYLDRITSEATNDFSTKSKTLESEINKSRQKQQQDLEKVIAKKEYEYIKQKEEEKKIKNDFIKEFRRNEQKIIHERKMKVDKQMEEAKKYAKNKTHFNPQNYLYNRLANQYKEKEMKFLNSQKNEKKKISGIEEISIVKRRIIECKYELEKRRIEKTNEMKQLWHSRSVAVAKYPSNILKQLNEYDQKKIEEEEKQKMRKIVLSKERERYVKENVALPPICEKLKLEREKRQISFLNMEGKDRVKCIKNEIDKKIKNKYSLVEDEILKKLENKKTTRGKRSKSREKDASKILIRSASDVNIKKYNNIKFNDLLGKSLSPKKLRMKKPNEINYLEQLRKERKIFSKNYVDWDKEIKNAKNDKGGSIDNIRKQIEFLDEKFKREKDLIKVKGGYSNNQELGNNMNNMIINAIRGKLALIENFDS